MFALALVAVAAFILAAILIADGLQLLFARRRVRSTPRVAPRRQPHLEDAIRAAFDDPAAAHGKIFDSYSVWKREAETRLELVAADSFGNLNEFTRCLIVRHLWRALEHLARGSVVIVDNPPQIWSESVDLAFHDQGVDPWRIVRSGSLGPQFAKE